MAKLPKLKQQALVADGNANSFGVLRNAARFDIVKAG
jgi:hypothetical protein